jgi:hypothetical protein
MSPFGFNLATMPAMGALACMTALPQNTLRVLPPGTRFYSNPVSFERRGDPNWRISVNDLIEANLLVVESYFARAELGISSSIKAEFNEHAERWEKETAIHSSPGATYLHRDYIAIMGIGATNPSAIVPLILKRIPNTGADWFFALENIAGENPAKDAEDFESAFKAWRHWAEQHGLLKENDGVLAA